MRKRGLSLLHATEVTPFRPQPFAIKPLSFPHTMVHSSILHTYLSPMEKPSVQKNGVLKLPPGFRFHPTDEELVLQYLKRKVHSCPLPSSIIPEINLAKYNPWDLPGGCEEEEEEEERYFFHFSEAKYPSGRRWNGATSEGYWKAAGKEKEVVAASDCGRNRVVGAKRVLVFHHGRKAKPQRGIRTDWIMHEYRLIGNSSICSNGWLLCRIFKKKRAAKKHPSSSSPSASESSCVTEHSDRNGEEASSSRSISPTT